MQRYIKECDAPHASLLCLCVVYGRHVRCPRVSTRLVNAVSLLNRPTMYPAWRVRSNGGPGLESKGSSLPIPTSASLLLRFLLFGATIPSWPIQQMG